MKWRTLSVPLCYKFDTGVATYTKRIGKNGVRWRALVRRKGKVECATFATKTQAEQWALVRENEAIQAHYRLPTKKTLGDALDKYRHEVAPNKQGSRWEDLRVLSFAARETLLCARQLSSLSEADFSAWRDRRLSEVSASTVRRELALLGAVLGVARREWKWLSHDPLKIKKPKEPPARRRGVSHDEVIGIISHANTEVSCAFLLALETGMRAGEVLSLTWGNVDLEKRVAILPKTKNGDSRQVPLSQTAVHTIEIAADWSAGVVEIDKHVFTITGSLLDVHFRKARAAAVHACPSIKTLRFHDSRGEAVRRLSRRLALLDLARVIGHRDLRSLTHYYDSSAEELAKKLG